MEGLILLLGEFLVLPLTVALTALVDLVVLGANLLAHLIGFVVGLVLHRGEETETAEKVSEPEEESEPDEAPIRRRFPWKATGRWIGIGSASVLGLLIVAVALANWVFFDAIVRWQLAGVQKKTGIAVTFDSAGGSLWKGVFELEDVELKRPRHETSQFDLTAQRFTIDLSTIDLVFLEAVFERVEVEGLRGTYDRVGLPDRLEPRKRFEIGRLDVGDAAVRIRDHTRGPDVFEAELQVDSLVAEPLRSDWAVFDVLFRSNTRGRINGQAFSIAMEEIPDGRQTRWQGDALPVELMASYLGGPLEWIKSAKVDVDATDRWQLGDSTEIEMHWKVVLRDVEAEVPADASRATKAIAGPAVAYLNKKSLRLPLEFDVVIDRNRFHFAASPETAKLGRTIGDALAGELGRLVGLKPEAIKEAGAETWNRFKGFLDKRRKGEEE